MKNPESHLLRLLAMARQAPPERIGGLSPHLQNRVLAQWKSSNPQADVLVSLHALLRGALVCATVVMLASIVWSYTAKDIQPDDDLALANLELSADVLQ